MLEISEISPEFEAGPPKKDLPSETTELSLDDRDARMEIALRSEARELVCETRDDKLPDDIEELCYMDRDSAA